MNCRELRQLWKTELWERRTPDALPEAVRDHLRRCPACAALTRSDRVADAALRRLSAAAQRPMSSRRGLLFEPRWPPARGRLPVRSRRPPAPRGGSSRWTTSGTWCG
jgi:hypothetical protein